MSDKIVTKEPEYYIPGYTPETPGNGGIPNATSPDEKTQEESSSEEKKQKKNSSNEKTFDEYKDIFKNIGIKESEAIGKMRKKLISKEMIERVKTERRAIDKLIKKESYNLKSSCRLYRADFPFLHDFTATRAVGFSLVGSGFKVSYKHWPKPDDNSSIYEVIRDMYPTAGILERNKKEKELSRKIKKLMPKGVMFMEISWGHKDEDSYYSHYL